jgi:glycine/D-amino acid oxidase-like deaminating enzyme
MKQKIYAPNPKSRRLRPPDLYEFSIDNFWFKAAGIEEQKITGPLRGSHTADVVIVGGGFTGLSSAYNIQRKFPDKKILLLEGAFCGYGASGRNGGFFTAVDLLHDCSIKDAQLLADHIEVSFYGLEQVKQVISDHGVDCDFRENGMLNVAFTENQAKIIDKYHHDLKTIGLNSSYLTGNELAAEIKSPRIIAGQITHHGAIINPAKLAREMKRVVEELGVEVLEKTVVTRISSGETILVDTELGEVRAPILVLGLNAYAPKLGLFKNRIVPVGTFIVATEPLTPDQWDSIGWKNKQGLSDGRNLVFNYSIPSVDGRIITGGSDFVYYENDRLISGNEKTITRKIIQDLFKTFPQLEGLKIEHAWGGTTAVPINRTPSVGLLPGHDNIYYGGGYDEGVPTSQTAGRIIADLIAGESNKFTNHFIVNRKYPYLGPVWLRSIGISLYRRYMNSLD